MRMPQYAAYIVSRLYLLRVVARRFCQASKNETHIHTWCSRHRGRAMEFPPLCRGPVIQNMWSSSISPWYVMIIGAGAVNQLRSGVGFSERKAHIPPLIVMSLSSLLAGTLWPSLPCWITSNLDYISNIQGLAAFVICFLRYSSWFPGEA